MDKIFCTGSSGFVGTHLCKRLGDFVPIPHKKITLTDFSNVTKVFFLSTYGNMYDQTMDWEAVRSNVMDLAYVLNSVDWNKIDSFVYFSTSSVKLKTQTMYSRTKRAAEEILLAYMEKHNVPIIVIRPTSITGCGEQNAHLIPTIIRSCLEGEEMSFVSGATHDFIDVEDIVDGVISLVDNKSKGIFELGTGKMYTNDEVLKIVEKVTGTKANIKKVPFMRSYDNDNWVATNFKSRNHGWSPKKTLETSIKEMVNAAKQIRA